MYRRFAPHYRAAIVYGATTIADDGAAMARILDPDFDLRNQAVSSVDLGLPTISPLPANKAEVVSARNDRIVIRAEAARAGVLVLADQYHPGWMATVDGRPVPVVRVNTILRGVPLSPGDMR